MQVHLVDAEASDVEILIPTTLTPIIMFVMLKLIVLLEGENPRDSHKLKAIETTTVSSISCLKIEELYHVNVESANDFVFFLQLFMAVSETYFDVVLFLIMLNYPNNTCLVLQSKIRLTLRTFVTS